MDRRRVVVTGLGVVASNGVGVDAFWRANAEGRSGLAPIDAFDPQDLPARIAGQVRGFAPADFFPAELASRTDRFVHFGLATAAMAFAQSGLDPARENLERVGVIVGSGLGGQLFHEEQMAAAIARGDLRVNPIAVARITPNAVAGQLAIRHGLLGPSLVISTACASGAHAIGEAFRKIQHGEADVCLAGGVEAPLTPFNFAAYAAMRVLSKRNDDPAGASRPFDRGRDGFVMGEGGAMLVLEERDRAMRRGAPILAEIAGYAGNSGAHHMVIPEPGGRDAARVMAAALRDARLAGVDYINAHATSTKANDVAETRAIHAVLGPAAATTPVSATKSMIGHALGAAGAIEAAVCVLSLVHQLIPPTINLDDPDPECALDHVRGAARAARLGSVMSNSFGFGSCNATLVFTAHP